jgi:hypothetical protein
MGRVALAAGPSTTEEWVLEQITKGKLADLAERFPNDAAGRSLNARFLEGLLTNALGDVKVSRYGVRIHNAILTEPINLENAEIPHDIQLVNCRFQGGVNLSKAVLRKSLTVSGSAFHVADFNRMKVESTLFMSTTTFAGTVNFANVHIAGNLRPLEPNLPAFISQLFLMV